MDKFDVDRLLHVMLILIIAIGYPLGFVGAILGWWSTTYIPIVGTGMFIVGGIGFYIINKIESSQEAKAKAKAQEEARLQRHREEQAAQKYYRKEIIGLGERSIVLFESMPEHLTNAEGWLDQAEVDFADGAFAPFWDSVENAANWLASFDERIRQIENNLSRYIELISKYYDVPPSFPLAHQSVERLGVGAATAKRMHAIVRTAQRNYQFASIYEQRKTNKILVAGFTNLAAALNDMAWHITDSINDLSSSVQGSMQAIQSRMGDIRDDLSREASESAARQKKVLDMLDNIQMGRRPLL